MSDDANKYGQAGPQGTGEQMPQTQTGGNAFANFHGNAGENFPNQNIPMGNVQGGYGYAQNPQNMGMNQPGMPGQGMNAGQQTGFGQGQMPPQQQTPPPGYAPNVQQGAPGMAGMYPGNQYQQPMGPQMPPPQQQQQPSYPQYQPSQVQVKSDGRAPQINVDRSGIVARIMQLIYVLLIALEAFLGMRFVFKLIGANPRTNDFVAQLYGATDPFVMPFSGFSSYQFLDNVAAFQSEIAFDTLIAMGVYAVLVVIFMKIVEVFR
jgi:hypothetical protein